MSVNAIDIDKKKTDLKTGIRVKEVLVLLLSVIISCNQLVLITLVAVLTTVRKRQDSIHSGFC